MDDKISVEIVTETWQRMSQMSVDEAPLMTFQLKEEQPIIFGFLLFLDDYPLNQHEKELILYMGLVVWQIMKQSKRRLRKVTRRKLEKADKANYGFLEMLASDSEVDFASATMAMLENYPEPEVLRYIIDTIMDEDEYEPDDLPIRDEYRGLAFVHLKTALDAFIVSLGR